MEKRRVVITGMGAVTPVGLTAPESWQALKEGVCGIGPITRFDASAQKVKVAAEVKNFDAAALIGRQESKRMARFTQFAVAAAKEAMADAGDLGEKDPLRCGVIVSSGIGGLDATETEHTRGQQKGFDRVSPHYVPMAIVNIAAGQIAIMTGFEGACSCPVTACAGGTYAVGDAFRNIRDGYLDLCLCGGAEACITPLGLGGFSSMKALSENPDPNRASIPFDKERDGFVLGEGAGILLLEELSHALNRGAKIYAEVVGYGATCDAHHITAPKPDGSGAAAAMRMALSDGGVEPQEVEVITAHGAYTQISDSGEHEAVKLAFGDHAYHLMMSSTKSMTGHMLGAAGAAEAVFTAMTLHDGFVPATIHYQTPDLACDLDVVANEGRSVNVRYAMSNSLGFGGHNGSILMKKWEE